MNSIVNEVIRGNFTSTKRILSIKSIKRIKSIKSQASNFLALRYFYARSDFFPLRHFVRIVVIFVYVRLFDVLMFMFFVFFILFFFFCFLRV